MAKQKQSSKWMQTWHSIMKKNLETDALDIDFIESFLKARDGMQFQRNEAPNNAAL